MAKESGGLIAVKYHDRVNEVQGDPRLAELLGVSCARAPFDRAEWFALLTEHCGLRPLLAVASDGEARAVLPLQRIAGRSGRLEALGNWYNFTVKPLLTIDALGPGLLRAIARDLKQRAWRVTLFPLPDEDGSTLLLQEAFRSAGWKVWRTEAKVNHVLEVAGRSYSEFLAARPGQMRTTLKRKAGKVRVKLHRNFDPAAWDDYETVYAASWKPAEGSPAFLRAFAEQEGKAGRLRLAVAYADNRPVAAQFWTVEDSTAFIHKLAHIEEAKPLSPGTTLSAALFEEVIDRDRVALIDFGNGDDPYKRDWMESIRKRYQLDCLAPGNPRAWPHIAKATLRHLAGRD
jgi:CelD/BcsL family acetyltransferase involved in cellulose biosynthesis